MKKYYDMVVTHGGGWTIENTPPIKRRKRFDWKAFYKALAICSIAFATVWIIYCVLNHW